MWRLTAAVAVLACALGAAAPARAGTASEFQGHREQVMPIVIVRGLTTADLPRLARRGAVGLVVPNAGPWTSGPDALAGLVRGVLYNARLPKPRDPVLVRVVHADRVPARGPAIVLGMPPQQRVRNDARYPIAVIGPGWHGILASRLTRVPGLVSMADVARTALDTRNTLRPRAARDPAASLVSLEARIVSSRGSTLAASVLVLALLGCFAVLYPRGAAPALGGALAGNLALGFTGAGGAATATVLVGLCTVAAGLLGARWLRGVALGWALAAVLTANTLALAPAPQALSLAPMGPELTSRFFGVSNLLETLLLVPALLGARLLAERYGPLAFAAVALLALVTVAENRLGADGGGAVVVAAAVAVLAVGLWASNWWTVVPALGAAALAVLVLLDVDAASSSPDHLRGALEGGFRGFARVLENRVPLAYARFGEQWYLVFAGLGAALVCAAAFRRARPRGETAVLVSLLAGLAASLLLNDSPGAVAVAGLAALLAVEGGRLREEVVLPLARRVAGSRKPPVGRARPQE